MLCVKKELKGLSTRLDNINYRKTGRELAIGTLE
jgi:hypothetical protein